jgi:hypothetical protein
MKLRQTKGMGLRADGMTKAREQDARIAAVVQREAGKPRPKTPRSPMHRRARGRKIA